jgi:hypothetical protein
MRIVHLSDIHVWRYPRDPRQLWGKRLWGVLQLAAGRARRFRLERLRDVVDRAASLAPDHVLITGDLSTTALPAEFAEARRVLSPLLADPDRASVLPGNHDRYTRESVRSAAFEREFGAFRPRPAFPWLRRLDPQTAILGLDPCRPHYSARGVLSETQLEAAKHLAVGARRLIVACHYPIEAPEHYRRELALKRLDRAGPLREWLAGLGPHLYCCGHVHAAWAFTPPALPRQLCLNAGAPLLRDPVGNRPPGFLEIVLSGDGVVVRHHGWDGRSWVLRTLAEREAFFGDREPPVPAGRVDGS